MRCSFRLVMTFFASLSCVHCGTAYTYAPSPTSSDTSGSGSTSTTSTTGDSGAGASTGGTSTGASSTGGSTGTTVTLLSLQVDGQGFNGQSFRGGNADEEVSARLCSNTNEVMGNVIQGHVLNDGTFALSFTGALSPNTAYNLALFVDADHNGGCDTHDPQYWVTIPAANQDLAVDLSQADQQQNVCDDFN